MAMLSLAAVLLLFWALGIRVVLKTVLAATTTPQTDLRSIRVHLEGLLGEAGPNREVISIERAGWTWPTRQHNAERVYNVRLSRLLGETETKRVKIEVSFFMPGRMVVNHWMPDWF